MSAASKVEAVLENEDDSNTVIVDIYAKGPDHSSAGLVPDF